MNFSLALIAIACTLALSHVTGAADSTEVIPMDFTRVVPREARTLGKKDDCYGDEDKTYDSSRNVVCRKMKCPEGFIKARQFCVSNASFPREIRKLGKNDLCFFETEELVRVPSMSGWKVQCKEICPQGYFANRWDIPMQYGQYQTRVHDVCQYNGAEQKIPNVVKV